MGTGNSSQCSVYYPKWNNSKSRYETDQRRCRVSFVKNEKYTGKQMKTLIGEKLNIDPTKLSVYWHMVTGEVILDDNTEYVPISTNTQGECIYHQYHVGYIINIDIKYFYGENIIDVVYDRNYQTHKITMSTHKSLSDIMINKLLK